MRTACPPLTTWYQSSVYSLYAADVVSGVGASFLVSPSITILDRAITLRASGAMKISDSIRYGLSDIYHFVVGRWSSECYFFCCVACSMEQSGYDVYRRCPATYYYGQLTDEGVKATYH